MSNTIEERHNLTPKYNEDGLIGCITQSHLDGQILMFAWMNEEALKKTLETGEVHYWSRSRQELWHKGATSGDTQKLIELKIDCDQDCLLAIVNVSDKIETEKACHTNRRSCFYRTINTETHDLDFNAQS